MPEDMESVLALAEAEEGAEGTGEEPEKKDNPVRNLRQFAEQLLKEKKAADKKALELEKQVVQLRQGEEQRVFEKLEVSEKHQKLFKAMNPDAAVTEAAITEFLSEYGLASEEAEGTPAPVQMQSETPSFKPTAGAGAPPVGKTYTSDDIVKLIMSGHAAEAHEIVQRASRNPNLITFKHADKMPA